MNPVNLANPFGENTNVVYTPSGAYFTNTSSATSFIIHPLSSGVFRAELNYMYVANWERPQHHSLKRQWKLRAFGR